MAERRAAIDAFLGAHGFAGAESAPQSNGVWQLLPEKPLVHAHV